MTSDEDNDAGLTAPGAPVLRSRRIGQADIFLAADPVQFQAAFNNGQLPNAVAR